MHALAQQFRRKRVIFGTIAVLALTVGGLYRSASIHAYFSPPPPKCIPYSGANKRYHFPPSESVGLSWNDHAAFWAMFPCARDEYRVVLPTTHEVPPPAEEECGAVIATAWFDIGRGSWTNYRRPAEEYFQYLSTVMSLRNPMAIYTSPDLVDRMVAERAKHGLMDRTIIFGMSLQCTPISYLYNTTESLMCDPEYLRGVKKPDVPERQHPWYNLLMYNKIWFFKATSLLPQVRRQYVIWLDAGCHPPMCTSELAASCMRPSRHARENKLRIAQVSVVPPAVAAMDPVTFYKEKHVHFAGTIFGAPAKLVDSVFDLFMDTLNWLLVQGAVDQDQSVFAYMYLRKPDVFDTYYVRNDWSFVVTDF